ncbi:collagen alpha-1(III) chain-like [Passer montanus]|uniref:collagen alpha-1(III) chain-like n=1 Tax=Passer montanus TaxID=9160 RepID=UPI00195FA1AD|nr:collagen alpha-1(III) chain-like [Passer montanus]
MGQSPAAPGEPEPCRAPGAAVALGNTRWEPEGLRRQRGDRARGSEPGRGAPSQAGGPLQKQMRAAPVPARADTRERGNRGGAICPALPGPALPCPALPCPALPCPPFGPAGGPGPAVRGSPVGAAKVAGTRVCDSRQDTAVQTPLHGHATRGDRAGTASALTHRCWLRAGQGCPPLPRTPAASRAPLRSAPLRARCRRGSGRSPAP